MPIVATDRPDSLPPMIFDRSLVCRHAAVRAAKVYWQACCGERAMPRRSDLDHAGMRRFIAHVGLIACEPSEAGVDYRIRLAGTQWEGVFGPMTGLTLSQFLESEIEARWREVFDTVLRERLPLRVATRLAHKGKSWIHAEMFVAPLSDDGEAISMIFMCFGATAAPREAKA